MTNRKLADIVANIIIAMVLIPLLILLWALIDMAAFVVKGLE